MVSKDRGSHHACVAAQLRMLRQRSAARRRGRGDLHVRVHVLSRLRRSPARRRVPELRRQSGGAPAAPGDDAGEISRIGRTRPETPCRVRAGDMIDKQVKNIGAAVAGIKDGSTLLFAGFGSVGEPVEMIHGVLETGARDLTVECNNSGTGEVGLAKLIKERRVRKLICSFPRTSDSHCFEEAFAEKAIELELVPQGTMSERMRAAGAGIAGFYTKTSAGTKLAEGKETRVFDGKTYVLEKPLKGDFALVKALKADRWGNLVYRKSARNFNPVMAMAADVTVVQVKEVVPLGALDPEIIVTPSIFVDRIVEVGT